MLEDQHGVVVADRRSQERIRVGRCRWHAQLESGRLQEPVLHTLRVLSAEADASSTGHPQRGGDLDLSSALVAVLRQLVDDLVVGDTCKVREHDLADGPQARHCGTQHGADDRLFGDRCVSDPLAAESGKEALGGLEHAAGRADILADQHHLGIDLELVSERADRPPRDR